MPGEFDSAEDDYDDTYQGAREPHRGVLILVLGILGLMVCGIIGIFAWTLGKRDLELMRRGVMDKEGEAMTRVGYILGIVATILMAIGVVLSVLYFVLIFVLIARK